MLLKDLRDCLYDSDNKLLPGSQGLTALADKLASVSFKVQLSYNNIYNTQIQAAGNALNALQTINYATGSKDPDLNAAAVALAYFLTVHGNEYRHLNFLEFNTLVSMLALSGIDVSKINVRTEENIPILNH